jgi:two-component system NtrC family sensor kinase
VHSLAYVPLQSKDRVIGVLGVDNRLDRKPLSDRTIKMLSALAEYAVIAIDNSALYSSITQERNKLDTILNHIQDGVIVIDPDQRIMFANPAMQVVFKWSGELINGQHFEQLIQQPEIIELIKGGGKEYGSRAEVLLDDGRVFSALLNTIPEVGTVITMHDITNLKKLDRIKSDFVSTVSHDLRSPLTAILGYVELLERVGEMNDSQREFVRRIQLSVQSITNLVNDLLNLGRIEAGFDTRREMVHLDQLLRFSVEGFRKHFEDKNHKIVLEIQSGVSPFMANPVQMRQMMDNLLDNAIKYTLPGGLIHVRLTVSRNQVILQVQDNGIGIPTVDIQYIFDKFYRASNASTEINGTGLGLSIVKSIVEAHNGRIWVDSTLGQGSTFTVVLQLSEA